MMSSEIKNIERMFNDAMTPNCCKTSLVVNIKAAKPRAVVALVMKVALPTFLTIRVSASPLFPCLLNSAWYLFKR